MYLKRPDGPRVVTLPDGTSLSRADLPSGERALKTTALQRYRQVEQRS